MCLQALAVKSAEINYPASEVPSRRKRQLLPGPLIGFVHVAYLVVKPFPSDFKLSDKWNE